MTHAPHLLPRLVLGDDCEECVARAQSLEGLAQLDELSLARLGVLAHQVADLRRAGRAYKLTASLGVSNADLRAVEILRLAARLVHAAGITEEDAR